MAQDQERYIEIAVSDTIRLKPVSITYEVFMEENNEVSYEMQEEGESTPALTLEDLTARLKKAGYNPQPAYGNDFAIGKGDIFSMKRKGKEKKLDVTVKNIQELKKLYEFISNIKGAAGKVKHVKFESPEKYNQQIYRNLFEKAKKEAGMIADISGDKIGKLISVSEEKNSFGNYMEEMSELMKEVPLFSLFGSNGSLEKLYERKLVFKFELKG